MTPKEKMKKAIESIADGLTTFAEAWVETLEPKVKSLEPVVAAAETETETKTETKPKRSGKPTKTEAAKEAKKVLAAATTKEETKEETTEDFDTMFDGPAEKQVTEDEVRAKLVDYARANGKDKTWALLEKYGAKAIKDIDKKHYSAIMTEVSA